eukprot:TRINITY_DN41158_c0_g1_i1.p1 TRINITY_DN41158_c0_g1~~TRINITY_DN41158_c0_g1_i1.p1  ORF type:complete len:147 (+),score=46.23 TRINITY_DN41158_c0_g1_i1:30-470(+)
MDKCMFFFFKQKTAYEMLRSLVGSEMCIRDSHKRVRDSLGDIPVELIPTDTTVENNRFVADMAKLTACGSTVVHVVCLTVDVSCFNEVGSSTSSSLEGSTMNRSGGDPTTATTWIEDAYQKVVSCVESTVCPVSYTHLTLPTKRIV